ncbi:AAA family ATPase [Pseudomonas siliginis]|uniref:AAA family ATPase n=1 Tax=Pseudomonas siliginis TaxID=2842346 RepID=UPI002B253001|nr:AAA family ATPase [Pseudomonas siliginis]MEB2651438.1 AAA family ATPase [Pseudomonas siliginis]
MSESVKRRNRKVGFCLISYEEGSVRIPLFDESIKGGSTNVTVLIGPNGSGKSRNISRIVDEVCYLNALRTEGDKAAFRSRALADKATLKYRFDGKMCVIERVGFDAVRCTVSGRNTKLVDMPFPSQVATVSHLPNDKFRFSAESDDPFYKYLGLRQSSNLTTTGALEKKVIQSLIVGFSTPGFKTRLQNWLRLIGVGSDIRVLLELQSTKLLSDSSHVVYDELIRIQESRAKSNAQLSNLRFRLDKDFNDIWSFLRLLSVWPVQQGIDGTSMYYELSEILKNTAAADVWKQGFDVARRWRAFKRSSLLFGKFDMGTEFKDLSSGEQQLIGTNSRLLAELNDHSLVVIDEPEISLHPHWQIKYIPTLLESLKNLEATHVLIATHSHFMVSDLDQDNSALVTARYEDGPKFELFEGDVYGRSPENILYRVFGVATTGNMYVESDLRRALQMIAGTEPLNVRELKSTYARLQRVAGPDNPAMKIILERIGEFIEGAK